MTRADQIYQEIKRRMSQEGLKGKEEYLKLIDDVIGEWIDQGIMSSEEDTPFLRKELERKWKE
jgi:hypothetical protein